MQRLPLIFAFFLSVSLGVVVLLLSIIAKVSLPTLLFRTLSVFFIFGILGALLGSILEIFLIPISIKQEKKVLEAELSLEDESIEKDLGDLVPSPYNFKPVSQSQEVQKPPEFKPASFPKMTVKDGKVVSNGDSAVAS